MTPSSGAIDGIKGDFPAVGSTPTQSEFLVEHKYTEAKSFRLSRNILSKIEGEAFRANKKPAVMLEFKDGETYLVFRLCDTDWEV